MRNAIKYFLLLLLVAFGADRAAAQTFPGLLKPGQVVGNNGTSPALGAPIPARTQLIVPQNYWVNGNPSATAACGPTGASTCSAGNDSNNCLTALTACLTVQHVYNIIVQSTDLAGFGVNINLAHGTSSNYSLICEKGPVIGQATITFLGDSTAPTAVVIQIPAGAGNNAVTFKDGCTAGFVNLAFQDNASNNGGNFINGGVGFPGHLDLTSVSFGSITGAAIGLSYGPATVTINGCSVTGNEGLFANVTGGGVLDVEGTCSGSSGLTFSSGFAAMSQGGVILATPSTFTGFSGITGTRCLFDGNLTFAAVNPNKIFPGSSDCVPTTEVGAIGVPSGSGGSSTYNYGTNGQPYISQGAGTPGTYGTLGIGGGGTNAATQSGAANNIFPTPTRNGDLAWWNAGAAQWQTIPGNNSGTQTLQENSSGTPSWGTVAGSGTVIQQVNAAAGGLTQSGNCSNTNSNSGSPCTFSAPGGFLNVLRNASLTAWFHGCVASACTITTAGGWCAEGVWVVPTGASVTCQQAAAANNAAPYYSMKITGASGVTDVKIRFVVESLQANLLTSQNVTFQLRWVNGAGGTVTPQLLTNYAGSQDNWGSPSPDLAATNMQSCTSAALCNPAYTLTVTNNGTPGYEFVADLGNNFSTTGKSATLYGFDARVTPGVAPGLNSNPPPIEVRDPEADIRWNERFYQASYDNGVAPGTATHTGIIASNGTASSIEAAGAVPFRTRMRCDPSVSTWDGAGTANKLSYWNGSAWTDGQGTTSVPQAGQNGFTLYASGVTANFAAHYAADCTISGG
jgi:hypothetical protein